MAHLTLVGLSEDTSRLLLVDDAGNEHTLEVDAALRAALRGDPSRLGQLEIHMESALRPRDIQARIRAGESPEAVAKAAQTTLEKIMPFAAPVLAERAHIADRAQRASVRRKSGDSGARTLGEAVAAHLREQNVPAESLEWDSWRREDGRWTLAGRFRSKPRSGTAHFAYDPPGNFVVAEDDDARWLVGDLVVAEPETRDDLQSARKRRLSSVPAEELPLGEDAIELVARAEAEASTADLTETADRIREAHRHPHEDTLGAEPPAEAFLDRVFAGQNPTGQKPTGLGTDDLDDRLPVDGAAAVDDEHLLDEPGEGPGEGHSEGPGEGHSDEHAEGQHEEHRHHEPPHRREVKKNRGRASVPSWDEIMFGGGTQE